MQLNLRQTWSWVNDIMKNTWWAWQADGSENSYLIMHNLVFSVEILADADDTLAAGSRCPGKTYIIHFFFAREATFMGTIVRPSIITS